MLANWPNLQIPEWTCSISHNAPFRTEMCTFLFWAVQSEICEIGLLHTKFLKRYIERLGLLNMLYVDKVLLKRRDWDIWGTGHYYYTDQIYISPSIYHIITNAAIVLEWLKSTFALTMSRRIMFECCERNIPRCKVCSWWDIYHLISQIE